MVAMASFISRSVIATFCSSSPLSFPQTPTAALLPIRSSYLARTWQIARIPYRSQQHAVVLRASAEGVPAEILEDPKFVPINDDDPQFGPPAMLLMGLSYEEVLKVQELLRTMEGDFLKVLICTQEMINGTLWDAMNSSQPDLEKVKVAHGTPRICFLSGLTGEEIMMFVGALPEADLEPTVVAALVPNNAQKRLQELMEEIMGDHERMFCSRHKGGIFEHTDPQ